MSTTLNVPGQMPALVLHELIRKRWSPRAFRDQPVEPEKLRALFEAARWAPSCFNEQPWRFVVATKAEPEKHAKILALLMEKNQQWAKSAWVLGFSAGKRTFTHNRAPDRYGLYDTGASMANLAIQATAMGLHAHFMGGFDVERARTKCGVPDDFEIGAAFAIGYVEGPPEPPGTRTRKPLLELVFDGDWGVPAPFAAAADF
jgi:nitroreductase